MVNGREAARSGEWAQHFSNASCLQNTNCVFHFFNMSTVTGIAWVHSVCEQHLQHLVIRQSATLPSPYNVLLRILIIIMRGSLNSSGFNFLREVGHRLIVSFGDVRESSLGPFHGAIAVPSVTRCRCPRCRRWRRGHRCAGGAR